MSFKLTSKKAELFKALMDQIAAINTQINIHFRVEEGMYIQGMDQSLACLFDISLTKDWFDEYTFEKEIVIGVSLEIMNKILACRSKNQSIQFDIGDDDMVDKFCINMMDGEKNEYDKSFETSTYSFEMDLLNIPEEENDIDITINSAMFTNVIEQIALFGDCVRFECSDSGITLVSKENKLHTTMTSHINIDNIDSYSTVDEEQFNEYNMSYFVKLCGFTKVVGKEDKVDIKITKDAPILMKYSIIDEESVGGTVTMCLAPKVSDEDDENY